MLFFEKVRCKDTNKPQYIVVVSSGGGQLTAILEKSTPMEKRKTLGSRSTMSVGENFAHTKYRMVNMAKGSKGDSTWVRLNLLPAEGGGEPEPCA